MEPFGVLVRLLCLLCLLLPPAISFSVTQSDDYQAVASCRLGRRSSRLFVTNDDDKKETTSYADSDAASKGIVSSLTNAVNSLFPTTTSMNKGNDGQAKGTGSSSKSPTSPAELMERIRLDYTEKNYLWTGNLDISAFYPDCKFEDPTLSFVGTEQFVQNVQNLKPIVDALVPQGGCRSDLLDIRLEEGFVQTRWNMVGRLERLPWKPMIDVCGRTKFWYEQQENGSYQVVFYDEEWEIPAGKALLQLITPAGTIPSTTTSSSKT